MEKESDHLIHEIKRANKYLSRQNSVKFQFTLAIVRGIGTAIGVTIIGGIVIGVLNNFVHSVYDVPILGKIVSDLQYLFSSQ